MNGEVIKQFLVGLGFGVDSQSLANFNKAIESASIRVAALYAGIQVAAAGIFWGISNISKGFEQMGYEYRIIAPAINKALLLRRYLLQAYSAAGINIVKTVQASVKFNYSLTKTKFILEALYKSVGAKFIPLLTKQMDIFRSKIYANLPKIKELLERVVNFIFKAFDATVRLGERVWSILGRVYDFFDKLDTATNGWSTKIIAVVAAWKLLNLSFIATPLGMLLTGMVALLALFDDFKTWQEGGQSLFDWTKIAPALHQLGDILRGMLDLTIAVFSAFRSLINLDFGGFLGKLNGVVSALTHISDAIDNLIRMLGVSWINKALDFRDKIDSAMLSGPPQTGYFNPGVFAQTPLVSPPNNANQNVSQQTSITVNGAADATTVGQRVTNEQTRVNANMTRNLRGATR